MNILSDKILEWLYPYKCPVCGEILPHGKSLVICPPCFEKLEVIQGNICASCGAPIEKGAKCSNCKGEFYFDSNISAFVYNTALREIIHDVKYRKKSYKAVSLATLMSDALSKALENYNDYDMVIPVPLHKARLKTRGYNQSGILALKISEAIRLPLEEGICTRTVNSAKQSLLAPAERFANVDGIFSVASGKQVAGKRIIIVDDILTTGATLNSLAKTLKESGAKNVLGVTLSISTVENHTDEF